MQTRKTRWAQFGLLVLSTILALGGWLTWFWWPKDYKWWVQLVAGVVGIVAAVGLIWLAWYKLLHWNVEWSVCPPQPN